MAETPAPPLYEVVGNTLHTHMHPGQQRAWLSLARFPFILAGTQSGKTSWEPLWLDREIRRCGRADYIVATANYDLFKLKLLPEFRRYFEHTLGVARYWAGERILELREGLQPDGRYWAAQQDDTMWGRIILRSAEAVSGLESATVAAAVLDEVGLHEWTIGAWEAILRRLSLSRGRALGATTLYELNWLKIEIYDRWARGDKDYDIIQFDSIDNPQFSREEYERARRSLPPWKFDMLYRGRWSRPVGSVYDCFDERACVMDRFPVPDSWLWYVGHDFGPANPAAMLYAVDPDTGLIWAVREYLPGGKSVGEQVAELKEMTRGRTVVKRVGGSVAEQGWRDAYTQQGWPILPPREAVKRVEVRIGAVYAHHRANRVMVFRDLSRYLEEKLSFSYKLDEMNQPTDELLDEARRHLMAAEGYILSDLRAEVVSGIEVPGRWTGEPGERPLVYARF